MTDSHDAALAEPTPFRYAKAEGCPDVAKHTKDPTGYLAWHEWAEKKAKTHVQERCPTCGFYAIWRKRD